MNYELDIELDESWVLRNGEIVTISDISDRCIRGHTHKRPGKTTRASYEYEWHMDGRSTDDDSGSTSRDNSTGDDLARQIRNKYKVGAYVRLHDGSFAKITGLLSNRSGNFEGVEVKFSEPGVLRTSPEHTYEWDPYYGDEIMDFTKSISCVIVPRVELSPIDESSGESVDSTTKCHSDPVEAYLSGMPVRAITVDGTSQVLPPGLNAEFLWSSGLVLEQVIENKPIPGSIYVAVRFDEDGYSEPDTAVIVDDVTKFKVMPNYRMLRIPGVRLTSSTSSIIHMEEIA